MALLLLLTGCSTGLELSVDVRSDYRAALDVTAATVRLTRVQGPVVADLRVDIDGAQNLLEGVRVLDAAELTPGEYELRVGLEDASGPVVSRVRRLRLDEDLAVTVLLSRTCEDVACSEGTTCIAGDCHPVGCGPGDLTDCPPPACAVGADCPALGGCFRAECALGQCLYVDDPSMCSPIDGGLDAGPPEGDAGEPDGGCAGAEICDNGVDDDCDMDADCADSDCAGMTCMDDGDPCTTDVCMGSACDHQARPDGASVAGTMRCCGGAAVDLASDRSNCGACGLQCDPGFDCTTEFGQPQCDCTNLNSQCHGGADWVCSTAYFVCACLPGRGACPGASVCIDDPMGPNYCEYP